MELMEYIVGMVLGGLTTGVIMSAYLQAIRPRRDQAVSDVIRDSVAMGKVATNIIRNSTVERCLVLCVTNGGGKPKLGATLYVTATINEVDEAHAIKWEPVVKMPVDIDYIRMLERLEVVGAQALRTDAMQEGSVLRDLYEKAGIRYGEAHYLLSTDEAFFFCSFAVFSQDHLDDSRHDIRVAVNSFKAILQSVYGSGNRRK